MLGTTTDDGTNKLQMNGAAKISGAATLGSTLNVTGAATLASLGVTGASTFTGTTAFTGTATFNGLVGARILRLPTQRTSFVSWAMAALEILA